jgi:hypothetical protein
MIAEALMFLGYKPGIDFECQDDGAGAYIRHWYSSDPQPSAGEIEAAIAAAARKRIQAMIDAERDRRVMHGFTFAGKAFQLDVISQQRITTMGADARFAIAGGAQPDDLRWADPSADFGWIAMDNSILPMDAQTMAAFADAAKLWVSRHTFAARSLKDADPIPEDFTDDGYWPS